MGKMQRTKGAVFEREVVHSLRSIGIASDRNLEQTRDGGGDIDLPGYMIECKRRAKIGVYEWLEQAERAAKDGQIPVVVARADRKEAIAIIKWVDFMRMLDEKATEKPYDPIVSAKGSI